MSLRETFVTNVRQYRKKAHLSQQELAEKFPELNLKVLIGSVRNTKRVNDIFKTYRPNIVYHAAFVPLGQAQAGAYAPGSVPQPQLYHEGALRRCADHGSLELSLPIDH